MIGVLSIVSWEDLLSSQWYKDMGRAFGRLGRKGEGGEWIELPKRGFYVVDIAGGDVWGPYITETEAVGSVVSIVAQIAEDSGDAKRVLH